MMRNALCRRLVPSFQLHYLDPTKEHGIILASKTARIIRRFLFTINMINVRLERGVHGAIPGRI